MRALVCALGLLLAVAAASAQSLVYAGRPAARAPFHVGEALAWYHCGVPPDEAHPIRVALSEATLAAGGGNVLYPGAAIDLRGAGVWLDAAAQGGMPFAWCEQRLAQSPSTVDPLGQWRSVVGWKISLHALEPGVWKVLSSNIVGMIAWEVIAEGGAVWIGTHLDTTKTPYEANETSGLSWPLASGQREGGAGNPVLLAWTEDPNARVRYRKLLRGFAW